MRVRVAFAVGLICCGCGDDAGVGAGTSSGDGSTGIDATSSSSAVGTSAGSSTTLDPSASSSSGDDHDEPPADEDFEWDAIDPLDCGDRGHVVLDSGPPRNRVNLVILGDGYTDAEIDTAYVEHVDAFLYAMFGPDGFPYDVYTGYVNICRIDVVSPESGIDFPAQGIEVDTAMDGQGDVTTRLALIDVSKVDAELDDALQSSNVEADWVAVTVNTEMWVGSGGYPMLWSGGHDVPEIGVHEAGHSFHDLADEYSEGNGAYEGGEPGEINVTADLRSEKWAEWIGFDQDDVGLIDFYEGARYFESGIWRPSFEGRMRDVVRSHNAPSIEKIVRDTYAIAGPVDDVSPKVEHEYPPALGLRLVDEAVVVVDWEVDGSVVLADAGPRIWTDDLELDAGAHEVVAVVRDPTDWVRGEDRSVLEMRVAWPIDVPANLDHTLTLKRSTARPQRGHLALAGQPHVKRSRVRGEQPHALGELRVQATAANAELLRARDEIETGRKRDGLRRLSSHADRFGTTHAADRAMLLAAIACGASARDALAARPHSRFAKAVRRACGL